MKKIGIIITNSSWNGGINYYKNLIYSNSLLNNKLKFVIISPDKKIKKQFFANTIVYETKLLKNFSIQWWIRKMCNLFFFKKKDIFLLQFLKNRNISLITHNNLLHDLGSNNFTKNISWIPDFQHIYLKDFFSNQEIKYRDKLFQNLIKNSNATILSSYSSLRNMKSNYLVDKKSFVLNFVSTLDKTFIMKKNKKNKIRKKYNLPLNWFFLPNQFWQHKNHIIVIKSLAYLKKKNKEFFVVCSGEKLDYRNKNYFTKVLDEIEITNTKKNFLMLGNISHSDVMELMRYSIATINPSLFEGWSTSVEESKAMGKKIILSEIDTHLEQQKNYQHKKNFYFFKPKDYKKLANHLNNTFKKFDPVFEEKKIKKNKMLNKKRVLHFAQEYQKLISKI
jgi:glycosyltransferase involved in cell wall biosynthesis